MYSSLDAGVDVVLRVEIGPLSLVSLSLFASYSSYCGFVYRKDQKTVRIADRSESLQRS